METQAKQKSTKNIAGRKKAAPNAPKSVTTRKLSILQVQDLEMDKVIPDPDQPRKTFDEESLRSLSESIAQHGVLQPITVRKSDKGFIIVMGERRYRASKLAKQQTIPAIIREYSGNDVLEVQIIENLQRKDVEPTEEAEAIAYLTERYSATEIANRLGRTENFIRQRIKLSGLIEGFKEFIRSGEMSLTLGVAVALFEPGEQQMMLDGLDGEFHANKLKRMVDNQTFVLTNAPFDLADEKLLPEAGACTRCPFNAANQGNLFGEGKMVCTRTACFESKKTKTLLDLIERAKKENQMLVPKISQYWKDEERNQLVISQMEKRGLTFHLMDNMEIMEEPVLPTLESIQEMYRHREYDETEIQTELDEAIEEYRLERERYDTATDQGFNKGILLHTDTYKIVEILVKVTETTEDKEGKCAQLLEKRKMAECTPEEQIIKINTREDRKKEIENAKLFEEVVQMIRKTDYINMEKTLSSDEMVAITISLYENNVGYYDKKEDFPGFFRNKDNPSIEEIMTHFRKNFREQIFNKLIRLLLTRQVHFGESSHTNDLTNMTFYNAMLQYYKEDIDAIENGYSEIRAKREKRIKERVVELQNR